MAGAEVTRKLTAILYADVAEYSRLTGEDELGTHKLLGSALDLISKDIKDKGGSVVHYAGDAVLADFVSVVAAVNCAVSIQHQLSERNAELPKNQRLQFRIGINLGEVIVDRDDIYGDGVNIAARLEALAEPGSICVSGRVFEQVHKNINLGFEDIGEQQVKNIDRPVRVYKVLLDPEAVGTIVREIRPMLRRWQLGTIAATLGVLVVVAAAILWQFDLHLPWSTPKETVGTTPDKPSILILPFRAAGGNPDDEIFGDAMTEDIIAGLIRFPGLRVLGRNTSFAYKGKDVDSRALARDLGVRFLLDGGIQRAEDRVRIKVRLVKAATDTPVWAESYDRELMDIFAIQDDVTRRVVGTLVSQICISPNNKLKNKMG